MQKPLDWDKNTLIGKAKVVRASKPKQGMNSQHPMGRQVFSHPQGPMAHNGYWGRQRHSKHLPVPLSSASSICWAWHHMVWNVPWVSWVHLSWLCSLPAPCAPQLPGGTGWGAEEAITLCKWCSTGMRAALGYQLFAAQIQSTAPYQQLWRKSIYPSQNQHSNIILSR